MKYDHHKIAPTADLVSYWRGFSDIPYAFEISKLANAKKTAITLLKNNVPKMSSKDILILLNKITYSFGAPMIEARYKCLDEQIKKTGVKNIYEIASGISPRSIILTKNPDIIYFATDLPKKVASNQKILESIIKKDKIHRDNLYFYPVNVLNQKQFIKTGEKFNGPICVIHEGLLPYLNEKEKQILGNNIKNLLKDKGGYWITPDVMCKDIMKKKKKERSPEENEIRSYILSAISGVSGRDMMNNAFESEKSAELFFKDLGFKIKKYPKYDGSFKLSSLEDISNSIEKEKMVSFHKSEYIYSMSLDE